MKLNKIFLIILFLTFLGVMILIPINFNMKQINTFQNNSNFINSNDNLISYGIPIDFFEYANRTDIISNLIMTYNNITKQTSSDKATIPLPPSWESYLLEGNIFNLQEKRNWVNDSGFESSGNWSLNKYHNVAGDSWIIGLNGTGSDSSNCVYMKMDSYTDGSSTSYHRLDTMYVSQNISNIDRGDISEVYLSFDYKVNAYSWDLSALGFNIFVAVNESRPENPNKTYSYWTTEWSGNPLDATDDICIWSCGDKVSDVLTAAERTAIGNYLDSGGKCYMSGSSIAYDSTQLPQAWSDWLEDYFNVTYDSFGDMNSLNGIADPYSDLSNVSLIDAIQVDTILNSTGGTKCLEYNTGQTSGVKTYRTMYHSFNFASISGENNRTDILNKTLEYLNSSDTKNIVVVNDGTIDSAEKIIQSLDDLGYYPNKDSIDVELFSQKSSIKKIFNIRFDEVPDKNIWQNTGLIQINPEYLTLPNIDLKIGLQPSSSVVYSGTDPSPEVWIDNFYLILKTKTRPSYINMTVNNITVQNNIDFGEGSFQQTNNFVYNASTGNIEAIFSWNPLNNLNTNSEISFDCSLNLFINKTSKYTPQLITGVNSNNSWTLTPYIVIPTGYNNHYFNFSKPIDWNITEVYEPLNASNNLRSLCLYGNLYEDRLEVPTNNLTGFPDGYWNIKAESVNYIKNCSIQILDNNLWNDNLIFYPGNICRIITYIRNLTDQAPSNVQNYNINLTIINPNSQIWFFNSTKPEPNGCIIFPNLTISGSNSTCGTYIYKLEWIGLNQAGYIEGNFTILHNMQIIPNNPSQLRNNNIIYNEFGSSIYLEIYLNNSDTDQPIIDATVKCNWTNETHNPTIKQLSHIGGGYYGINLETADLPGEGIYTVIVNASRIHFTNKTFSFLVDTRISSIYVSQPNYVIPIGDQINITATFNDSAGNPLTNGSLKYTEPSIGQGNLTELNPGVYFFTINSNQLDVGNYYINLYSEKYGSVSTQTVLTVRKIQTDINYTSAVSVETTGTYILQININDTDHNIPVPEINVSYNLQTLSGNLTDLEPFGRPGYYNTSINITLIPRDLPYSMSLTFNHENYSFPTVIISVTVLPITTYIYTIEPFYEIYYNGLVNISVNYNFSNGNPITGANLSYLEPTVGEGNLTEIGNGVYYFTINTSNIPIGTYSIIVSCINYGYTSTQAILIVNLIQTQIIHNSSYSVETTSSFNLRIYVNDTDHNLPISGVNVSYTLSTLSGNLTDESSIGNIGYYNTTIVASLSPRDTPYNLILTLLKDNYSFSSIIIPITVKSITTYIYSLEPFFEISYKNLVNISVSYNFTDGSPITGAILKYYEVSIGTGNLTELGSGIYYFTLNSSDLAIGTYYIIISSTNYGFVSTQAVLKIDPTIMNITSPSSLVQYTRDIINLEIWLKEEVTDIPISGVNISYFFQGQEGYLIEDIYNPGRYSINLNINLPPRTDPYSIVLYIQKENYTTETISIPITIISSQVKTPWYIQWGWLLGIAAALGAVVSGYVVRSKWRERNWERKINRLYAIHSKDGIAIYDRALTKKKMDSQLVSAALMGITGMVKELTSSKKKLKTIDHMDKKIIFEYGEQIIGAILADTDLPIIRKKLREFINLFEIRYQAQLLAWTGDLSIFKSIDKLTNTVFPFTTIISHREPITESQSPMILNKELLKILNTINDGLKEKDLISVYCGIDIDKVVTDLGFLIENGFIDNMDDLNLTEKGVKAIYHSSEYYKEDKEEKVIDIDLTGDKPRIPTKPIEIKDDSNNKENPPMPESEKLETKEKEQTKKDTDENKIVEFDNIKGGQPRIPKKPDKLKEKENEKEN
ncbi:MAG: hypothetical protein ACTSPY_11175 [Candidatus Helarchaeota archaeon]